MVTRRGEGEEGTGEMLVLLSVVLPSGEPATLSCDLAISSCDPATRSCDPVVLSCDLAVLLGPRAGLPTTTGISSEFLRDLLSVFVTRFPTVPVLLLFLPLSPPRRKSQTCSSSSLSSPPTVTLSHPTTGSEVKGSLLGGLAWSKWSSGKKGARSSSGGHNIVRV